MFGDLTITQRIVLPAHELVEEASRSGGPGGQHANSVSTRVTLRWNLMGSSALSERDRALALERLSSRLTVAGEIVLHVDTHRSRHRNRVEARERLIKLIQQSLHRERPRRATKPTRGSKRRRLDSKKKRGATKKLRGRVRDS